MPLIILGKKKMFHEKKKTQVFRAVTQAIS